MTPRTIPFRSIAVGDTIDFTSAGRSTSLQRWPLGRRWISRGTWTDGYRAALLFAPPPSGEEDLLAFVRVNEVFIGPEGDPMRVEVLLDGEPLTRWTLFSRYEITVCKVIMPARLMAGKTACRLEFHVENPQSTERAARAEGEQVIGEDPRELGIKIQRVEFASKDRLRYSLGRRLILRKTAKAPIIRMSAGAPPTVSECGPWARCNPDTLARRTRRISGRRHLYGERCCRQPGESESGRSGRRERTAGGQLDTRPHSRHWRAPGSPAPMPGALWSL